jgi:hypothetical protein
MYFSVDVESDGPIPGPHSMLSLGCAAFSVADGLLATFSMNLELLDGAAADPGTLEFWRKNQEAYDATRAGAKAPEVEVPRFVEWIESTAGKRKPVFVVYPAGFDFLFAYWYMMRFAGRSPFSHSALDIKTLAMVALKIGYRDVGKRAMPKRWVPGQPHTHVALDDAIEQGHLFVNIMRELGLGAG